MGANCFIVSLESKGLDVAGHTEDKTTDSESAALTNVGAILDNNQVQTMKECKDISGGDEQCTGTVAGTREWAAAQHLIVVMEPLLQGRTNTHTPMSPLSAFQPHHHPHPCMMGSFTLWSSMACRVPWIHVRRAFEGKLGTPEGPKSRWCEEETVVERLTNEIIVSVGRNGALSPVSKDAARRRCRCLSLSLSVLSHSLEVPHSR